eukprot:gene30939-35998_t
MLQVKVTTIWTKEVIPIQRYPVLLTGRSPAVRHDMASSLASPAFKAFGSTSRPKSTEGSIAEVRNADDDLSVALAAGTINGQPESMLAAELLGDSDQAWQDGQPPLLRKYPRPLCS